MKPSLDRVGFRPDQLLAPGDLAQASRRSADLLHLHTSRGHGVWGVARGYGCTLDPARREVTLAAGVAIDAHGRQLVLSRPQPVPLPATDRPGSATVFDLVARWGDGDGGAGERPVLRWVAADPPAPGAPVRYATAVRLGTDVPLVRWTAATAGAPASLDVSSRPVAHGLVRPKIATGRVRQYELEATGTYSDWRVTVPTGDAGLVTASPVYVVGLDAHPFGDGAVLGSHQEAAPPAERLASWDGPFVSVESKSTTQFRLRVVLVPGSPLGDLGPARNPVPFSWIGVDTPDPGPVVFSWPFFLLLTTTFGGMT